MKEEQFIDNLRAEMRAMQESRGKYIRQKFTFVTGLLGVGAVSFISDNKGIETANLLYIVPVIAMAFDLYVLGEDFAVKRIGRFLGRRESSACDEERKWEEWVSQNRDPFCVIAGPILSAVVLIASACLLWTSRQVGLGYFLWITVSALALVGVHVHGRRLRHKLEDCTRKDVAVRP